MDFENLMDYFAYLIFTFQLAIRLCDWDNHDMHFPDESRMARSAERILDKYYYSKEHNQLHRLVAIINQLASALKKKKQVSI